MIFRRAVQSLPLRAAGRRAWLSTATRATGNSQMVSLNSILITANLAPLISRAGLFALLVRPARVPEPPEAA